MNFTEWLSANKLNKVQFCQQGGINYRSLNLWLSGASEPVLSNFEDFSKAVLKVDPNVDPVRLLPMDIYRQKAANRIKANTL